MTLGAKVQKMLEMKDRIFVVPARQIRRTADKDS